MSLLPVEAIDFIYARWTTSWGTTSPYTFDNESYDPDESEAWVRLVVRHADSNFETLGGVGNRRVRREGSIVMQIFTPSNEGVSEAHTLTKAAADIFEGVSFNGIDVTNVVTREVGPSDAWYLIVAEAFFAYEERK